MKHAWTAVGLAVLVAGVGGVFLFSSAPQKSATKNGLSVHAAFGTAAATASSHAVSAAANSGRYTITPYGTSFIYPSGWRAKQVKNGTRTIVTITPQAGQNTQGIQISITPVGESLPVVTPARIHQDLPNLAIENPRHVTIDGQDILVFVSHNASYGGEEGWFVHSGALYQISAMPRSTDTFTALISSLHF